TLRRALVDERGEEDAPPLDLPPPHEPGDLLLHFRGSGPASLAPQDRAVAALDLHDVPDDRQGLGAEGELARGEAPQEIELFQGRDEQGPAKPEEVHAAGAVLVAVLEPREPVAHPRLADLAGDLLETRDARGSKRAAHRVIPVPVLDRVELPVPGERRLRRADHAVFEGDQRVRDLEGGGGDVAARAALEISAAQHPVPGVVDRHGARDSARLEGFLETGVDDGGELAGPRAVHHGLRLRLRSRGGGRGRRRSADLGPAAAAPEGRRGRREDDEPGQRDAREGAGDPGGAHARACHGPPAPGEPRSSGHWTDGSEVGAAATKGHQRSEASRFSRFLSCFFSWASAARTRRSSSGPYFSRYSRASGTSSRSRSARSSGSGWVDRNSGALAATFAMRSQRGAAARGS